MKRPPPPGNIVFVSGSESMWGAERSLLGLAKGIHQYTNLAVHLVGTEGALFREWSHALPDSPAIAVRLPRGRLRELRLVLTAWAKSPRGSTLVLFEFRLIATLFILVPLARLRSMRVAVDVHDSPEESSRRKFLARFIRLADAAVCVSSYIAEQVRASGTEIVFRPIERSGSGSRVVDTERIVVGVIGQISPHKRVESAFELVAGGEGRLICIVRGASSGPAGDAYLERILQDTARFPAGRISVQSAVKPEHAFKGIDVLFAGNALEPSSRAVAEAQMLGIPAIVPDRGGAREFIEPGVTGFVFPSSDPGSIVARLLDMTQDEWETMSQRAQRRAHNEFDAEAQIRKYVAVVRGLN